MIRASATIFAVFCVAVIAAELLAAAFLWHRGELTRESLGEMYAVLDGAAPEPDAESAETETVLPTIGDIKRERAMRILNLESRETELALLKEMTTRAANELIAEQKQFDEQRTKFADELAQLDAQQISAATEQTRAILLELPPADAVEKLMVLSVEEDVQLLTGMPEKSIAKILQEFRDDPEQVERGREIFEAISRGAPATDTIDNALGALDTTNR